MQPSRRRFLAGSAGTAVALLAGCLDAGPGTPTDSDTPSPTDSHTPTQSPTEIPGTPTLTPFPDEMVEWPEGPKERPPIPDDLTEESVREFVATHEYRYVYNTMWFSEHTEVDVDCGQPTNVQEYGSGWKARVTCTAYSNTQGTPHDGETATVVHGDYFSQTYEYLVDEDTVIRREPPEEE